MYFDYSLTVPAGTTAASPATQEVKLTHGIIHRVEIGFLSGPRGMVHIVIRDALHQLWPTNPDGSFNSDKFTIAFNEYYEFFREPFTLILVGWSPDTTYDHVIEVRFGILPSEVLSPEATFAQAFKKLIKRLRL